MGWKTYARGALVAMSFAAASGANAASITTSNFSEPDRCSFIFCNGIGTGTRLAQGFTTDGAPYNLNSIRAQVNLRALIENIQFAIFDANGNIPGMQVGNNLELSSIIENGTYDIIEFNANNIALEPNTDYFIVFGVVQSGNPQFQGAPSRNSSGPFSLNNRAFTSGSLTAWNAQTDDDTVKVEIVATVVPVPATAALLVSGLMGFGLVRWRKREFVR